MGFTNPRKKGKTRIAFLKALSYSDFPPVKTLLKFNLAMSRIKATVVILLLCTLFSGVNAQTLQAGAGALLLSPQGGDKGPPAAPYRSDALLRTAAQTNQWYSSLLFHATPEPLYAHPLSVRPTAKGLEMALPVKAVIPTERKDVEIHYAHQAALTFSPQSFAPSKAVLSKASDWSIDIGMSQGANQWTATVAHGSPYVFFRLTGDVLIDLPVAPEHRIDNPDPRILALQLQDRAYAVFGPTGVRWEKINATQWRGHMPPGKGYFAAAGLPQTDSATLALLSRHAYAFVTDTRVNWAYTPESSQVQSTFEVNTQLMEGAIDTPLLGLYPHQWHRNASLPELAPVSYSSLRGPIKLLAAKRFSTRSTYQGFVPYWPGLTQSPGDFKDIMKTDVRNARRMMLEIGQGPYWQGKGLQRIGKLMDVVEQQGDVAARDQLLGLLKSRIEQWFSGKDRKSYFHLDKALGTVTSYPEEYFSVEQMNDHHFHYGYWIRTMADIALRDPQWASKAQWGGMVDWLIADIATAERGRSDFPFLRNFDPYEGHSWASGVGLGAHGNNQESSSEAINAWAGLILWGEITRNPRLRDLGIYLYTTEIEAIEHYWFDVHGLVLPPEYRNVEVSMLFGGKIAHNTWWIDEPRQIKGINLLPMTTSSTYLGRHPAYIERNMAALKPEMALYASRGKYANPPDIWQDIFAKYLALAQPQQALDEWKRWGSFELGDTRSHALHWMLSLKEMGTPDSSVTANTPLFAVFKTPDGRKTYLAFNAGPSELQVQFSDGKKMTVAAGKLAREP